MTASDVVVVDHISKSFDLPVRRTGRFGGLRTFFSTQRVQKPAVQDISFTIGQGEVVGYLGPNGAGKSTTIKILTGILLPTAGDVRVCGLNPWQDRKRNAQQIGAVFGQRSLLWWDLPLQESFDLVARLYRIAPAVYRRRLDAFIDLLDVGNLLSAPVRTLSLGQRMRGDLIAAMLHQPRVLYLDEPTVGLDVVAKRRIREFVASLAASGDTTVMLTTHDLDDVEALCGRILVIDHGRLLYDGDVGTLRDRYARYKDLLVTLASTVPIEVEGATVVKRDDRVSTVRFDPAVFRTHELIAVISNRYDVTDISVAEPDLEEVIHTIYTAPSSS